MPADARVIPLGVEGTDYERFEEGVRGGTLYVAVLSGPKTMNHVIAAETSTTWVTQQMHRGLLSYHPSTGSTVLDCAKSRELSEDGLVLTFALRQGIKWSDGTPMTADDVLFTYNDLILNEDVACSARDLLILPDGSFPVIEKVDDYTVVFTVSTIYRPFLDMLSFGLMPKHRLAHRVHRLNPAVPRGSFNETWTLDTPLDELVGNGPYVLAEYQADTVVVMQRNPYYYGYDTSGTQLPYYDRIMAHIVPNQDTALLRFRNGEIDVYGSRGEDVPILLASAAARGFTVMLTDLPDYGTRWFLINQDIGLAEGTDDAKRALYRTLEFRQALAHLIDKEAMIANVFNGMAFPLWSPTAVSSPFYAGRDTYGGPITESNAVRYEYDPAAAQSMLDAIGVVDRDGDGWRDLLGGEPLIIRLVTNDNTEHVELCLTFLNDLRAAGLNATFQVVDFNTLVNQFFAGITEVVALALATGDDPNSGKIVYGSCGRLHGFRFSACAEPDPLDLRIDELLRLGASTFDLDESFGYYAEYQRLVAQQLGFIFTVQTTFQYAYYNHVGNAALSSPIASPTDAVLGPLCFDRRLLLPAD